MAELRSFWKSDVKPTRATYVSVGSNIGRAIAIAMLAAGQPA